MSEHIFCCTDYILISGKWRTHPPAAAAWRQVLPSVSGVSIWKPADRTESLHIMLNLRPDGSSAGKRRKARQDTAAAITEREEEKEVERETGVSVTGGETRVTETIMHIEENTRTGIGYRLHTERDTHWSSGQRHIQTASQDLREKVQQGKRRNTTQLELNGRFTL